MSKPRSIFEEVDDKKAVSPRQTGTIDKRPAGARRGIRLWLMLIFLLVVVMIAVGGLTRLTDSGLSITEWRPIAGALPPMTESAWQAAFDKYREIPEYQLQNKGMSLGEFQFIYWWEWGHRQLGRVIGLVWSVGFFGFLIARKIPPGWTGRLLLLGVLGGLQGAIGWWMVASGLTGTMLDVASYRLATHLGLAFLILGLIAWFVLKLGRSERELLQARRQGDKPLMNSTRLVLVLTGVQLLLGALVAGIDAGRSFGDWPMMAGQFIPPDPFEIVPGWRNFFENAGLVQFNHRVFGYLLVVLGALTWWRSRRNPNPVTRGAYRMFAATLLVQVLLGIVTVLYGALWTWAIAHQLGAVALIVLTLRALFFAKYPQVQSIRGR